MQLSFKIKDRVNLKNSEEREKGKGILSFP